MSLFLSFLFCETGRFYSFLPSFLLSLFFIFLSLVLSCGVHNEPVARGAGRAAVGLDAAAGGAVPVAVGERKDAALFHEALCEAVAQRAAPRHRRSVVAVNLLGGENSSVAFKG
jgi:hypothetical protein